MRCGLRLLTAGFMLPAFLCAQQAPAPDEIRVSSHAYVPPSPYSIRVETKLVELNVAVRDWNGHSLHGLKREEFRIYDEGKEREIAAFSEERTAGTALSSVSEPANIASGAALAPVAKPVGVSPPARFLALFIDDVNAKDYAAAGDLGRTQAAAMKFVTEALAPRARIGVFTASGTVTQDFTTEASKLTDAIASLKPHPRMSEIGLQYCPRITPYRAYRITRLHDRETVKKVIEESGPAPNGYDCAANPQQVVMEAEETWRRMREISADTLVSIDRLVSYLGNNPGPRIRVMASSGFFGQTLEQQENAVIDHALQAGVIVNALDSKGLYSEAPLGCRPLTLIQANASPAIRKSSLKPWPLRIV